MANIRRRPAAEDDLVAIWLYIADDDIGAANRLLDRFEETFALLADNPRIGRRRPELMPEIRSFTVGRYVVFYRPADDGIEIVRVIHGARDIENAGVL
jgi:toxin ParE1/3/4